MCRSNKKIDAACKAMATYRGYVASLSALCDMRLLDEISGKALDKRLNLYPEYVKNIGGLTFKAFEVAVEYVSAGRSNCLDGYVNHDRYPK